MKDLLKEFAEDFTTETGIKVHTLEERTFPHWKRLVFNQGLNCEQLEKIASFIKTRFSQARLYSHLMVTLGRYEDKLCLTADVKDLERVYNK